MMMFQFNNLSCLKSRSWSLPSSLRQCQRNRRRSGTIDPLTKEKRSRCLNSFASTLSTNWPTSRPGLLSTSSSSYPNQPGRLLEKRWLTPKSLSTQLPIGSTIDEPHSLNVSCVSTDIVFTPEDMQVQGRHARPLYFTRYIG